MKKWLAEPMPWGVGLAACLVIGLLFAGGAFLFSRIQAARVDAIEQLCRADNRRAQQNIDFIASVSPDLRPLAVATFVMEGDCHAFAVHTARNPPPQPP